MIVALNCTIMFLIVVAISIVVIGCCREHRRIFRERKSENMTTYSLRQPDLLATYEALKRGCGGHFIKLDDRGSFQWNDIKFLCR